MASGSSDEDDFVSLGTLVPDIDEDQHKKPTTIQDLTAKDKQGRRRFHGAFQGGFSAGFFNTVGTKEGFTPSTFVSSKNRKLENDPPEPNRPSQPEDFMDEEDLEEHGIAPRKFATVESFTSEERKRKRISDCNQMTGSSALNVAALFNDLVVAEQLTVGIKLLRKMGWREGQGLGPRKEQKKRKKKKKSQPKSGMKVYGCARPPSDESDSSDEFVPEDMSSVTFAPKDVAPKDVAPISVEAKENVHGLGYRGLDPTLALPSSHINLFSAPPVRTKGSRKGISGQAFGVGAFEDEDEDIYAMDSLSNYDITMQPDNEEDNKFGWTAPRDHGKQSVPVTYVGKLLEGFCLSKKQLKPKKKFPAPALPRGFKAHHWFRKHREMKHIPEHLRENMDNSTKLNAVDRGILLGETPVMSSVFDLIPKADRERIDATKEAISITQSLTPLKDSGRTLEHIGQQNSQEPEGKTGNATTGASNFLSRFQPADSQQSESHQGHTGHDSSRQNAPLFQNSLTFQPFRKDPAKQSRYDKYLVLLKQGSNEPYNAVAGPNMTEWERARERDEFSKAAKMFRPMSAMMSSRFVSGAMIDDDMVETSADSGITQSDKSDEVKAAEMKMFGKLTREEHEWHPHQLLCKRFNVPNPFPGSDIVGVPGVKRDKYSVFNFLSVGDFRSGETQEPKGAPAKEIADTQHTMTPSRPKKATMASVFKVLNDPNFHKQSGSQGQAMLQTSSTPAPSQAVKDGTSEKDHQGEKEEEVKSEDEPSADMDLFRAIFKNSDSEDSEREEDNESNKNVELSSEEGPSSAEELPEEDDVTAEQRQEKHVDVKKEVVEDEEAIQDTFRPLFTRRPKPSVDQPTTPQPLQSLPDSEAASQFARGSADGHAANKPSQWRSQSGSKSIFSVLEDMGKDDGSTSKEATVKRHSDSRECSDNDDEAWAYGPKLPPPITATCADKPGNDDNEKHESNNRQDAAYGPSLPLSSSSSSFSVLKERSRPVEKSESKNDSRKESRSSHRKERRGKSKHRKKKHKKHKKSSSSKSRSRSRKGRHSSSGSEADTESDSGDSVSDSELLQRLKDVSKSTKSLQRMKHL